MGRFSARHRICALGGLVALVMLLFSMPQRPAHAVTTATSPYTLPIEPGVTVWVMTGNNVAGDHDHLQTYAFDFAVKDGKGNGVSFTITATQGGEVIGVDDTRDIVCQDSSTEKLPINRALDHCPRYGNFILIRSDDGRSAALYLHLAQHSAKVRLHQHVSRGQTLALAGMTGMATGIHLHFQVEDIPSWYKPVPPGSPEPTYPVGWWLANSHPTSFANSEVLSQDADGVPREGQHFFVSPPHTPISLNPPEAGHVLRVNTTQSVVKDDTLNPISPRCSGPRDGQEHAIVSLNQHLVVMGDTALQGWDDLYFQVAYPDPCQPGSDFSRNDEIANGHGAVGWVAKSTLDETWLAQPINGANAAVRNCWGPDRCADQHLTTAVLFYYSADGNKLYAWWTGAYWDPHWFHVKDDNQQGIAVYGRDWAALSQPPLCQGSLGTGVALAYSEAQFVHTVQLPGCGKPPNPPAAAPTPTPQPTPNPTATPTPVPQSGPTWRPWYSEYRPACLGASGNNLDPAWNDVNQAATRDCSSLNGLQLSQYSNALWAEADLDTPLGSSSYNQIESRNTVTAGFLNPGDTSVWAAMIVQTPQAAHTCGGFILAINSQGYWTLQEAQVASGHCTINTVPGQSGQIGTDPGTFTMQIIIHVHAGIIIARNAEIKVADPSLGDTLVERPITPREVLCAQESNSASHPRFSPAEHAHRRDCADVADQPTDGA